MDDTSVPEFPAVVQPSSALVTRRRRIHPAAVLADFDPTKPVWVAHRCGGSTVGSSLVVGPYPENTSEAGRACLEAARTRGIANFVLNFQFRRCGGGVIALHDEAAGRVTSLTGNASDLPVEAFRGAVDAGAWHSSAWGTLDAPTLEQVLTEFGGRCALLLSAYRVGDPWIGQRVADAVVAHGLEDTVIVSSWATADLTPAKAAGIRVWYNPPAEGQAGSSAVEILATDVWPEGTPKYIGVDVASSQGYVESLTAAGLSVMIHYTRRRHERDACLAYAGSVAGFASDEPIYQATNVALTSGTDPTTLGLWPHGALDADSSRGRGVVASNGQLLDYASNTQWCVIGGRCPIPTPTSYTITGSFCFESDPASDPTRNLGLYLCCPDDKRTSNLASSGAGLVNGYVIWIRRNGYIACTKKTAAQTESDLSGSISPGTAIAVGQVVPFTVVVTATTIKFTRDDTGETITWTDPTYRGPYFQAGHSVNATASFMISRAS